MKKQYGFSTIELLLALLLVSFISFAGYYVWNSQHDSSSKMDTKNESGATHNTDTRVSNEAATWLTYTSPDKAASIKLPDGYAFEKSDNGLFVMALEENMTYQKGVKATFTELLGRDAVLGLFVNFDGESNASVDGAQTTNYKTDSGVAVTEYYQTYTEESEGIGPAKGTKEYIFIAYKNDKRVVVTYVSMTADELSTVKKMVKTISID